MALRLPEPPLRCDAASLRSWKPEDAPILVAAWNDPRIAEFNGVPDAPSLALARTWIDGEHARLARGLSLDLVIENRHGHVVGEVGLSGFSPRHAGALIGYWLLPSARGEGIASQCVELVATWAHVALELDVIVAKCHENNVASQRVALRAGFEHEANDATGHQLWRSRTRE